MDDTTGRLLNVPIAGETVASTPSVKQFALATFLAFLVLIILQPPFVQSGTPDDDSYWPSGISLTHVIGWSVLTGLFTFTPFV